MFESEDDHDDHGHEEGHDDDLGVAHEPAYIGLMLAVCCMAVLLNITIVSFNWIQGGLNSSINVFLTNLAVSDILLAGVVTPLYFHIDSQNHTHFVGGVGLCKLFMSLQLFNVVVAVFTVVTMAMDRYRCIIKQKTLNRRMAVLCVGCLWTTAFIISIPQIYEYDLHVHIEVHDNETEMFTSCSPGKTNNIFSHAYSPIVFVLSYLIPLGLLIVSYACIVVYLSRHSRQLGRSNGIIIPAKTQTQSNHIHEIHCPSNYEYNAHSQSNGDQKTLNQSNHAHKTQSQSNGAQKAESQSNGAQKAESQSNGAQNTYNQSNRVQLKDTIIQRRLKVIKMLISITGTFATLWSPYFILFVRSHLDGTDDSTLMHTWPHVISRVMTVISTISNPVINIIFNRDLRQYIACSLIRCRLCRRCKHNRVKPLASRTDPIATVCS